MTRIGNPFVHFTCAGCGQEIARQVNARRCVEQLDELRAGPPLWCARCSGTRAPAREETR